MLLADQSIREYASRLASGDPAPGGGSAAALTGALGIALAHMVGSLSEGRAKYAEHADFIAGLLDKADTILNKFLELVDEDAVVFNEMSAAYRMPKATPEEKAARSGAIQEALRACAVTPYKMMDLCMQSIDLTAQAIGKTNANVLSDLGVAALCLKAAVQSAWINILINLAGIKDAAFAAEYRKKGEDILTKALPMADDIYMAVKNAYGDDGVSVVVAADA